MRAHPSLSKPHQAALHRIALNSIALEPSGRCLLLTVLLPRSFEIGCSALLTSLVTAGSMRDTPR